MTAFVIIGHTARADGEFSLNDLPGAGGRMDILCRCAAASFFLSHGIRKENDCYLVLSGGEAGAKTVKFTGISLRSMSPDERSSGALIKKALAMPCGSEFRESSPGVLVRKGGLEKIAKELSLAVFDEHGTDVMRAETVPDACLLSDHLNFTACELDMVRNCPKISVGPECLHADHAITLFLNELDRRRYGWK